MRLEKQKQANVLYSGDKNESIGMSLDMDSAQVLMQMLSKNLYSDAVGSAVRECASNALDSHRRAGVNKPIIVSLVQNKSNNWEFSVEDFGTGLDHHDVQNIISKYGKSTKRNSNTELGMMGLGFKAPLAYASSFYFTCRKDGMERKYMMYEGEETNTIDLINETPTTECNGVKVTVPIRWGDKYDFRNKIKQQLAYFEDVYFNVDDIDNEFTIHRSKLFQFSELSEDNKLHICLDNVYYPLDFDKMGMESIYIPIGLRFSLTDGIFPTPNRESLIYTKETKKTIKSKLTEFANYCVEKYNEGVSENSEDVVSYLDYYYNKTRIWNVLGTKFDLNSLNSFITIPFAKPKLEGVDNFDITKFANHEYGYFTGEYRVAYRYENDRMYKVDDNSWHSNVKWDSLEKYPYLIETAMKGHKKSYLREICGERVDNKGQKIRRTYFVRKTKPYSLMKNGHATRDCYYTILNLNLYDKSMWRAIIKEFQYIQSLLFKHMVGINTIEIPEQWLLDKKAQTSSKRKSTMDSKGVKVEGDFNCKVAEDLLRENGGRNCKFVSGRINIDTVEKGGDTFVYTSHDEYIKLDNLYHDTNFLPIKYITFSNREMESLEKSPSVDNLVKYEDFIAGHSLFIRFVTAMYCNINVKKWEYIYRAKTKINLIKSKLTDKLIEIELYRDKNIGSCRYNYFDKTKHFLDNAKEQKLFNDKMKDMVDDMDKFIEDNIYVATLSRAIAYGGTNNNELIDCMAQLFRCNGVGYNASYVFLKDKVKEEDE